METLKNLKALAQNKVVKFIGNVLYILLFIIVILMLIIVIMQRTTDNAISLGGYRMFTVATGSMVPKYEVGDILIAKEIQPEEVKMQDDVVYKGKEGSFKDKVVTHQVIAIMPNEDGTYNFITKGIANDQQDPEISGDQIYGKVIYKIESLSYISKLISNIYIFYFFVFIPIAIIIFKQIKVIASSREDDEEDEEDEEKEDSKEDNKQNDEEK